MTLIIFENSNLLLGVFPESLGMLIFGISLISLAVGLRWFLARLEDNIFLEEEPIKNFPDLEERIGNGIEGRLNVSEK